MFCILNLYKPIKACFLNNEKQVVNCSFNYFFKIYGVQNQKDF